jgi:hypothetical protein
MTSTVRDVKLLAQTVMFIALFYDGFVVPGTVLLLASGTWLIISYYGGWQFLKTCPFRKSYPRVATEGLHQADVRFGSFVSTVHDVGSVCYVLDCLCGGIDQ